MRQVSQPRKKPNTSTATKATTAISASTVTQSRLRMPVQWPGRVYHPRAARSRCQRTSAPRRRPERPRLNHVGSGERRGPAEASPRLPIELLLRIDGDDRGADLAAPVAVADAAEVVRPARQPAVHVQLVRARRGRRDVDPLGRRAAGALTHEREAAAVTYPVEV